MPSWQSIRFRLSVQYSALVFGIGGGLLGLVYLAVQRQLRAETMTTYVWSGQRIPMGNGQVVTIDIREVELRAIESIYNEVVLDQVAQFTLLALVMLFLLSLVVGWIMSGRVLKPVGEITTVAQEIQASDLSRRIALTGPDDELKRLGDTFDEMLERLDIAFSSQRQFLADTSHDLRTPLTVIRSNVELLAEDPHASVEDWRQAGAVIRRNAEKMSEMSQGLLATARMQTGRAQAVEVDLAELVRSKVSDFTSVAAEKGVVVASDSTGVVVQGVEVALDRAISNLLDNAVRAAPEGSVVTVGCGLMDDWAWMGVRDAGPGLPPEPGDRVGLGLSIVTQIAESHGGGLVPFSGPGSVGTTMVIWLPAGADGPVPTLNPLTVT